MALERLCGSFSSLEEDVCVSERAVRIKPAAGGNFGFFPGFICLLVVGKRFKMPRSFLVKKHFNSAKKPNYSELECPTAFVSQQLLKSLVMPVIPQPEVLSPVMYSPITMWTASDSPPSPLPTDLSPVSGYPSPKDGHGIPRSDEDEHEQEHEQPASITITTTATTGSHGASDGTEKFRCALCHKSYSTYAGLLKHKQLHCDAHARKAFSCKYCEKEYVSLGALKMHIRTHTLPCVCKLCGKAFSRPWLLQGHIRTHTGEKPFSCSHCSRAFADRSNLRAHLQTHSDVKKYQCKNCSKTFSRMSLLHKHEESGCCVAH